MIWHDNWKYSVTSHKRCLRRKLPPLFVRQSIQGNNKETLSFVSLTLREGIYWQQVDSSPKELLMRKGYHDVITSHFRANSRAYDIITMGKRNSNHRKPLIYIWKTVRLMTCIRNDITLYVLGVCHFSFPHSLMDIGILNHNPNDCKIYI